MLILLLFWFQLYHEVSHVGTNWLFWEQPNKNTPRFCSAQPAKFNHRNIKPITEVGGKTFYFVDVFYFFRYQKVLSFAGRVGHPLCRNLAKQLQKGCWLMIYGTGGGVCAKPPL